MIYLGASPSSRGLRVKITSSDLKKCFPLVRRYSPTLARQQKPMRRAIPMALLVNKLRALNIVFFAKRIISHVSGCLLVSDSFDSARCIKSMPARVALMALDLSIKEMSTLELNNINLTPDK